MKLPHQERTLPTEVLPADVRIAVAALEDRQAAGLKVLDLSELSDFTDHFIICSGGNSRQVQALADQVQARLGDDKIKPLACEGYEHATWVLLDYGHFLIHIFDPEARDYYRLEGMWTDAPDVTRRATA